MYRRAFLIYNPVAGGRRPMEPALGVLRGQVESVETCSTSGPGSATELAREACRKGADLVVAFGGDGTINEVVNGLVHTPVPLGVLPAGTANVLALELGLPVDPVRAVAALPGLQPRRISLGRVRCDGAPTEWRYFLLMSGAGVDGLIVYTLNTRWKSHLGILSYWLAGLAQLGHRPQAFQIEIGPRRIECTFALASKSSQYGGRLRIAAGAHLLADELEVVLFQTRSSLRYLLYLGAVATRTLRRFSGVTFLRAHRLELSVVESLPVHMQVDGEYAGRLPATVEMVPDALTLLMPKEYVEAHG